MDRDKHELGKLSSLYGEIRTVLENARQSAYRAVNFAMVQAYWRVGCLIVENEQEGKERAEYGKAVLKELSHRLTREFDKGYSVQALRNMRQFYLVFSKRSAVRSESPDAIEPVADKQFEKYSALRSELTWTHYKSLMRVENDKAREWYMNISCLNSARDFLSSPARNECGLKMRISISIWFSTISFSSVLC